MKRVYLLTQPEGGNPLVVPDPNAELQKHIHQWMQLHREEGTCFLQKHGENPKHTG